MNKIEYAMIFIYTIVASCIYITRGDELSWFNMLIILLISGKLYNIKNKK